MGKPNYNLAKRQKEALRRARQEARLQRRQARRTEEPTTPADVAEPPGGDVADLKP